MPNTHFSHSVSTCVTIMVGSCTIFPFFTFNCSSLLIALNCEHMLFTYKSTNALHVEPNFDIFWKVHFVCQFLWITKDSDHFFKILMRVTHRDNDFWFIFIVFEHLSNKDILHIIIGSKLHTIEQKLGVIILITQRRPPWSDFGVELPNSKVLLLIIFYLSKICFNFLFQ